MRGLRLHLWNMRRVFDILPFVHEQQPRFSGIMRHILPFQLLLFLWIVHHLPSGLRLVLWRIV